MGVKEKIEEVRKRLEELTEQEEWFISYCWYCGESRASRGQDWFACPCGRWFAHHMECPQCGTKSATYWGHPDGACGIVCDCGYYFFSQEQN